MKTVKTGSKYRANYSYEDVFGEKYTLHPGDTDPITGEMITAEWIAMLHRLEDNEVYNNLKNTRLPIQKWERPVWKKWRAEHPDQDPPRRLHVSMDAVSDEEDDSNQRYMAEASIAVMKRQEDALQERLREAVEMLDPERRELYRRLVENEEDTQTVASDYGVDPSAIRHRMSTIRKHIEKILRQD